MPRGHASPPSWRSNAARPRPALRPPRQLKKNTKLRNRYMCRFKSHNITRNDVPKTPFRKAGKGPGEGAIPVELQTTNYELHITNYQLHTTN
jgi:hypothetical protein